MTTYYVVFDNDWPLVVCTKETTAKAKVEELKRADTDPMSSRHYFHIHDVPGDTA